MSSGLGRLDKAVRMEKQQQVSKVSQLSLDQRFSDKGRRSSARLRHQSLDRGMDRPSLDEGFGGTGQQLPMTAPHCRWTQTSCADRQPLHQRFSNGDCRLSATGLHHLKTAVEQQDNSTGLQPPMTASTLHGQQARELPVAAVHDCNGNQPSSSHITGCRDRWWSEFVLTKATDMIYGFYLQHTVQYLHDSLVHSSTWFQ